VFYICKIILIELLPPTDAAMLFLRDKPNPRRTWAKSLFCDFCDYAAAGGANGSK